ncbi:hypothetical protein PJF56_14470 [Roseofilum sp. BLCC_M91]|uniref:Uncharacterized protein n=1 Tax=Roseofilum halophilum BLCC-M91 TaxID=3022259 RepID=A0ABT7BP60_9CYAN|nr:hypothetical protein [Roseofilum halophilum]MDJ1180068.1 hypothetical protein [Roseofilum halophilum BLCC-M91]
MANTMEFKARIKQGMIEIPEEYQQEFREENEVTVIVLKQSKLSGYQSNDNTPDIIDALTENPIKVDRVLSREEIYDR